MYERAQRFTGLYVHVWQPCRHGLPIILRRSHSGPFSHVNERETHYQLVVAAEPDCPKIPKKFPITISNMLEGPFTVFILFGGLTFLLLWTFRKRPKVELPPGPKGLPIVGSFFEVSRPMLSFQISSYGTDTFGPLLAQV